MTPEIIAPTVFVVFAAVILIYTQLITPRRVRRRISLYLTGRGWMRVPPDRDYTWADIMTLAIEEKHGPSQINEYDRTMGPFTVHEKTTRKCSGKALELYRDAEASQHRYAALGIRKETVLYSRHSRFLFLRDKTKKFTSSRELWIGEVRRIPVDKPEKVYNAVNEMFGGTGRKIVSDRGVNPDSFSLLESPSEVTPARAVREVLQKTGLARSIMADVYLGPGAWVLVVSLPKVGQRIADILSLIGEISRVIDEQVRRDGLTPASNTIQTRNETP